MSSVILFTHYFEFVCNQIFFSFTISAEGCFKETLRPTSNAVRSCDRVGGDVRCTYVCKSGHVYFDGTTSKQYNCSVANKWYPTANPEYCLCKYFQ